MVPQEEEDRMRDGGVEQELFELSSQAVEVGKKNLQLSRKLVSVKDDFRVCMAGHDPPSWSRLALLAVS